MMILCWLYSDRFRSIGRHWWKLIVGYLFTYVFFSLHFFYNFYFGFLVEMNIPVQSVFKIGATRAPHPLCHEEGFHQGTTNPEDPVGCHDISTCEGAPACEAVVENHAWEFWRDNTFQASCEAMCQDGLAVVDGACAASQPCKYRPNFGYGANGAIETRAEMLTFFGQFVSSDEVAEEDSL